MEQEAYPPMPTGTERADKEWAYKFLAQEERDMKKEKYFKGYVTNFHFKKRKE